jgi:hypothetical protein
VPGDFANQERYHFHFPPRILVRSDKDLPNPNSGSTYAQPPSTHAIRRSGGLSLALHEYAIALALRPIATPDEARNVVDVTYLDLMGIPLRVMVSYVHIYQALFVTVDFGYALGVIRPDFGVIINC